MADRLRQKGVPPSRVHLIPNWADLEGVRPQAANNKLRPELGVGPEDLAVLYAGNLGAKQGLEIILECAHLTREDPHIKYVVAGEGAIRASLEEQARQLAFDGTVIFLPVQSNSRFPLLLAMGDIHLVLQKQQVADLVMPSKLTNIMAAGRPFIATATPDTELGQVTMASQAGVLIPPEDGARLAEVIRALSADVSARAAMGRRARQYAETYLAKDPILTRLEDLLLVHRKMLTPKESI
jgi:colanic acid biosynthesis glycosyl transferase WcaI